MHAVQVKHVHSEAEYALKRVQLSKLGSWHAVQMVKKETAALQALKGEPHIVELIADQVQALYFPSLTGTPPSPSPFSYLPTSLPLRGPFPKILSEKAYSLLPYAAFLICKLQQLQHFTRATNAGHEQSET